MSAPSSPADHQHPHRPGSARAALSYPHFRRMWMASALSSVGTWMQNVVLPKYILDRTGNTTLVGLIVFAQLGPLLLLSLPAGVIADRFDRRRWLVAMQLVQLAFSAALAPLASADAPLWAIMIAAIGVGTGNALNAPSWAAMLPTLVTKEDLPGSVSLNYTSLNGSRVIGPIIVAALVTNGATVSHIFLINAATYLFVVGALLITPVPRPTPMAKERPMKALATGVRIVRSRPELSRLLLTLSSFSVISLPFVGLFVSVVRLQFGVNDKSTYEWMYSVWGFGAALGGLSVGTIFVRHDKRTVIRGGFVAFAITLGLFAVGTTPLWGFVVGFFLGIAYFMATTAMNTIFQSRLEDNERGRVTALWFMSFGGSVPVGNLIFAPVIDAIGPRWVLGMGALWALFLAWWCDIAAIDRRVEQQSGRHALQPDHAAALDEHGLAAGE